MSGLKSTYEIKFPEQTTYFIAYTDTDIFAYGIVTPEQEMTTGQPFLWTTLSEEEWVEKLITEFHTDPYPPDPVPPDPENPEEYLYDPTVINPLIDNYNSES